MNGVQTLNHYKSFSVISKYLEINWIDTRICFLITLSESGIRTSNLGNIASNFQYG